MRRGEWQLSFDFYDGYSVWLQWVEPNCCLSDSLFVRSFLYYILYLSRHCGRIVSNMPAVFFALLSQDPLHLRRYCIVRSREISTHTDSSEGLCSSITTSQACRSSVHEVKNYVRMCPIPTSRFNRTSTAAENTNWLGYYTNEVRAVADGVGWELHSRLVDLIDRQ
jgi:hypothetical protein